MELNNRPCLSEKEPNDTFKTATNISLNKTYYGSISSYTGGEDFFSFELKKKSPVTIFTEYDEKKNVIAVRSVYTATKIKRKL